MAQFVASVELWSGRLYRFIFDSDRQLGDPCLLDDAVFDWCARHATMVRREHIKRVVPRKGACRVR